MNKSVSVIVIASVGVLSHLAAEPVRLPIPLEKGTQWIYEAKVKWTPVAGDDPPGVRAARFKWSAEVVETLEGKNVRAAVVHAWPDEAGGMDPTQPTGYSVLLENSSRL